MTDGTTPSLGQIKPPAWLAELSDVTCTPGRKLWQAAPTKRLIHRRGHHR
jgi:hypothetical protein